MGSMHQKKFDTSFPHNPTIMVLGKIGSFAFFLPKNSFQLIFSLKHIGNTLETLLNQLMAAKTKKNRPKTRNSPEAKKTFPSSYLTF
jgi:hypothetical protein